MAYIVQHNKERKALKEENDELKRALENMKNEAPSEDANAEIEKKKAELVEYFAPLSSKERIESLLFVDMVFRLHNSLFENDTFELTDKWLSILK